jgi:hypothetical protein
MSTICFYARNEKRSHDGISNGVKNILAMLPVHAFQH